MTLLLMCLTVTTAWAWDGSGTFNDPYQIKTTGDLNQLASSVNGGTGYEGMYFKLMNDINFSHTSDWDKFDNDENNFTPIGGYQKYFEGNFDGNGKTISGIRISLNNNDHGNVLRGLFGNITSAANIHDLTLTDTRITGYNAIGSIVGHSEGTITNCHIANNVAIQSVYNQSDNAYSFGGIAGDNGGTITNCTSAVTITISGAAGKYYGAIAGENSGVMVHNFANGATIPAASNNSHGAITGDSYYGTLTCNLYYNCTVAGVSNATGVGSHNADVAADNGAMPGIILYDNSSINSRILEAITVLGDVSVPRVALAGRTLYKDAGWNTLCLPFEVEDGNHEDQVTFSGTPLEGATVMTLSTSSFDQSNGTLTLNFAASDHIGAGVPYIIKWDKPEGYDAHPENFDIHNPVFSGVTVSNTVHNVETSEVFFLGCFSPVEIGMEDRTKLYLTAGNNLCFPGAAMTIGSCRAYFQLVGGISCAPSRIVTNLDAQNTVTTLENALPEAERVEESMKLMINGHIYILHDGSTYDALGRRY